MKNDQHYSEILNNKQASIRFITDSQESDQKIYLAPQ